MKNKPMKNLRSLQAFQIAEGTDDLIKKELDSLAPVAERTHERLFLFNAWNLNQISDVEYLRAIKEINIRKQLDEFPI